MTSDDADYGKLSATVGYQPDRITISKAEMADFLLSPELIALAGPRLRACKPAGVLSGTAAGTLQRQADGRWRTTDLKGEITGRDLSANCPENDLHLTGGSLELTLAPKAISAKLDGRLADGQVTLSAELLPQSERGEWFIQNGKLSLVRAKLREFKGIANRPPNELNGRITIDMAGQEDYGFSGPLTDPARLQAKGHASFGEGHLWQLPLFRVLRSKLFEGLAGILRGRFDPTSFRRAETDFRVADAKVHLPNATVDSDLVRVAIDGDVHFDRRLDLHLASSVRNNMADRPGGGLGDLLPERWRRIIEQIPGEGGLPLVGSFWHVTGTFDEPIYNIDVERTWNKLGAAAAEFLKRRDDAPPAQPGAGADPPPGQ
jgi:hypothetical protein